MKINCMFAGVKIRKEASAWYLGGYPFLIQVEKLQMLFINRVQNTCPRTSWYFSLWYGHSSALSL